MFKDKKRAVLSNFPASSNNLIVLACLGHLGSDPPWSAAPQPGALHQKGVTSMTKALTITLYLPFLNGY